MKVLEVQDLRKNYKDVIAVDGLSFDIEEGMILGLLGPNGAGKTTAISVISTLFPPNEGDVLYKGKSILKHPKSIQKDLGYVPQEIGLFTTLTARDNLLFWGKAYGLKGNELNQAVKDVLGQIGLSDHEKKRVKTFSGGMKRRLNIGVALLHHPKFIIMDEPTVGIDPQSRQYILDIIKTLNREGSTILYTSHYIDEVEQLCNEILIMDHGKKIAYGTKEELLQTIDTGDRIILRVNEVTDKLVSKLKHAGYVTDITADKAQNQIIMDTEKRPEVSKLLIHSLAEVNVNIESIEIKKPSLETVFLNLTGRSLRD